VGRGSQDRDLAVQQRAFRLARVQRAQFGHQIHRRGCSSLTPLGQLPDEVKGFELGEKEFGQKELGPADALASMGDLFSAFDNDRLNGRVPTLRPSMP